MTLTVLHYKGKKKKRQHLSQCHRFGSLTEEDAAESIITENGNKSDLMHKPSFCSAG